MVSKEKQCEDLPSGHCEEVGVKNAQSNERPVHKRTAKH